MWFEGDTTPSQFLNVLFAAMATPHPSDGQPMWTNVSSNLGSVIGTDDGYVFKSIGESGTDKVFIQITPTYYTPSLWHQGFGFRSLHDYTPGAPGTNGTKVRPTPWVTLPYNQSNSYPAADWNDQTKFPIHYAFSINRERIIIMVSSRIVPVNQRVHTIIYSGRIKMYDTSAPKVSVTASNYDLINGSTYSGSVMGTNNANGMGALQYRVQGESYLTRGSINLTTGQPIIVMPILLQHSAATPYNGLRGEFDGILYCVGTSSQSINPLPDENVVTIDGKDYRTIVRQGQSNLGGYSNFTTNFSNYTHYFVEKK